MTILPPQICTQYYADLLSIPLPLYRARHLLQIGIWLLEKIERSEFQKFPSTVAKLKQQYQQFMELYERTKIEEEQAKEKGYRKTQWFGYRPRLTNRNDHRLFERLSYRAKTSKYDRWIHEISNRRK